MRKSVEVTVAGVKLIVDGEYTPPERPRGILAPETEDFEAERIWLDTTDMRGKVDLTDLLELDVSYIEDKILEECNLREEVRDE